MQPKLFSEIEDNTSDEESKIDAGKRVIQHLLDIRRKLKTAAERELIPQINQAVKVIRSQISHTDAESEELILNAIEKSQAGTFEEIAEDTRLPVEVVQGIVRKLASENILGITSNGKKSATGLIFSKRKLENQES